MSTLVLKRLGVAFRRFFARLIDILLFGIPAGIVAALIQFSYFSDDPPNPGMEVAMQMILLPVILFFEYLVYKFVGTTPGKALLSLEVRTKDGRLATPREYGARLKSLYVYGLFFSFPLLSAIAMLYNLFVFLKKGETVYDEDKFEVVAKRLSI